MKALREALHGRNTALQDASTAPCAMSRCLRLPQTKWIGESARDALSDVKVLEGLRHTKRLAIGERHCGSNNSKGTELMEPAIVAPLMPFPPRPIGHGPLRLTSRRSFFPAMGRVKSAFRKPLVAI